MDRIAVFDQIHHGRIGLRHIPNIWIVLPCKRMEEHLRVDFHLRTSAIVVQPFGHVAFMPQKLRYHITANRAPHRAVVRLAARTIQSGKSGKKERNCAYVHLSPKTRATPILRDHSVEEFMAKAVVCGAHSAIVQKLILFRGEKYRTQRPEALHHNHVRVQVDATVSVQHQQPRHIGQMDRRPLGPIHQAAVLQRFHRSASNEGGHVGVAQIHVGQSA